MEKVAAATLPPGYTGEWTDTAFHEKRAGGKTAMILGFAILFAYLFLVSLYESWTSVPVLLSVSVGVLGSYAAIMLAHLALDLYAQIGMVVLIGLAADRHPHRRVREGAAGEGCAAVAGRDRGGAAALSRPVMMTSLAFILGVFPLVALIAPDQFLTPRQRQPACSPLWGASSRYKTSDHPLLIQRPAVLTD